MNQEYLHGEDADMSGIISSIPGHIMTGEGLQVSSPFMGLEVFAVICALRENDSLFYGETVELDSDQLQRLTEIEASLDSAIECNAQYFPFGHNRNERSLDKADSKIGRINSAWGAQAAKRSSIHSGKKRASEFISGPDDFS